MRADGDRIPAARTFDELKRDPGFMDDSAAAIVTMVQPHPLPAEA
jgi:hypothetical protein